MTNLEEENDLGKHRSRLSFVKERGAALPPSRLCLWYRKRDFREFIEHGGRSNFVWERVNVVNLAFINFRLIMSIIRWLTATPRLPVMTMSEKYFS